MEPPGVSFSPRPLAGRSLGRRALAAGVLTIVAACQAPAATPNSSPNASPTGAPESAPPATAAPASPGPTTGGTGLRGLFHVVGSEPVIPRTAFADRGAVLPGAVAVDADGGYHAWVIAFGDPAGTQEVHYLTSSDAISWSEVEDGSLAALSDGFGNPGAMPSSVIETADGWVMYLTGALTSERFGWDIWRATAPSAAGPWTRSAEPVLRRGAAGTWDAGALDFPTVIPTDDGYAMFYSAIPTSPSSEGSIGLATSADGLAWTRHGDPVATAGLCGGFDDRAIHQPRVVASDSGLFLVYVGYGDPQAPAGVGFASSLDGGVTWGCQWPSDALNVEELPPGGGVHTVNAFMRGARVSLLVEWLAENGTDVWLAHLGPREP